jgi:transcription elongation factor Elf1
MSLRDRINENPTGVIAVAIVLLAGASGLYQWLGRSPNVRGGVQYKDTVTGELFLGPADETPPITSPAGNEAVVVYMYGCGGCGDDQRFEAFYLKYEDGVDVYSTNMEDWYDTLSEEYPQMRDELASRCDEEDGALQRCPPGRSE